MSQGLCTAGVGRVVVWFCRVLLELCERRLFALTEQSLHGPATCDARECRSFCFSVLDLEYAFLTFVLHLQKLFKQYHMKILKEEKGKEIYICSFGFCSSEMKQKLDEEGNKCNILSKQQKFNEHCCIRCCSPFTFLINSKRQCQDCKYNICKSCSSYQKKEKAWICSVCQQAR